MACASDRAILSAIFNPLSPNGECVYDEDIPDHLRDDQQESESNSEAKTLELEAIQLCDKGDVNASLELFTKAIALSPHRPSAYNNRAQARRLQNDVDGALEDLNEAIRLSQKKGKAGCQALVQRGLIYLHQDNKAAAEADLRMAAELGSPFAKAMLTQMNPYAALCNQMLQGVFSKLRNEEQKA